jgi:thiol-disulfide isomerase/thioredoxin
MFPARSQTRAALLALVTSGLVGVAACARGEKTEATPAAAASKTAEALWSEAQGYDLFMGQTEDGEARVFQSPDYGSLLVVPGTGSEVWVLQLAKKEAAAVARDAVTVLPDGARLMAGASRRPLGATRVVEADVHFKTGAVEVRLAPEPPLLGAITLESLLAKKKDYAQAARSYKPNNAALAIIKNYKQPLEVVVFFGTWCSYCKKYLPALVKTLEAAGNPGVRTSFYGVDEDLAVPEKEILTYAVTKTPTIIIRSGDRELGRIAEEPKETVEEDLALILMGGR